MEENYEDFLKIDINNLHEDFVNQPVYYSVIAEAHANADQDKQQIKEELAILEAEVEMAYRSGTTPMPDGVKVTEGAIKAAIALDKEVQKKRQELIEAVHDVNILSNGKVAMEHRKESLKKLSDLYITGYWATPEESESAKIQSREIGIQKQTDALNTPEKRKRR